MRRTADAMTANVEVSSGMINQDKSADIDPSAAPQG